MELTQQTIESWIGSLRPMISLLEPGAGYYRGIPSDEDLVLIVQQLRRLRHIIDELHSHSERLLNDGMLLDLLDSRDRHL